MSATNAPTEPDHVTQLRRLDACNEAIEWAKIQPSAAVAWSACENIDWMTWLLRRLAHGDHGSPGHRQATLLACLFARTTTNLIPSPVREEAEGILSQIEQWAWGESQATRDDLSALRRRASDLRSTLWQKYAAAYAAYAAYAAAAAYAAYAAYADAAYADAAADAYGAAWSQDRQEHVRGLCDLLRSAVPCPL